MAFYLRPSWRSGSSFGPRTPPPGATTYGAGRWHAGNFAFVESIPLVMHDACAHANGVDGMPWDAGRDRFGALAGGTLCWSPVYSDDPDTAPPCYWCGERAVGRG